MGGRRLKTRAELARDGGSRDAAVAWESKLDHFDNRLDIWNKMRKPSEVPCIVSAIAIRDVSLFEFYWKYYVLRRRIHLSTKPVCLMVTPSFSADCARVSHDRHEAYARTAVVAFWRMLPTLKRHQAIADHQHLRPEDLRDHDKVFWGATEFLQPIGRYLGVQDLILRFDERKDRAGEGVGWGMALVEMLVDPMLSAWVPGCVVEQCERWHRYFRGSLRWALR